MADLPKQERAEVDTTLPFRSFRDALHMFGDASNVRKNRASEKPMQQASQELGKLREKLNHVDEAKPQALSEFAEERKLSEVINHVDEAKSQALSEFTEEKKLSEVINHLDEAKSQVLSEFAEERKLSEIRNHVDEAKSQALSEFAEERKLSEVINHVDEAKSQALSEFAEERKLSEVINHADEAKSQAFSEFTKERKLAEVINQKVQYSSDEALDGVEVFKFCCQEEEKSGEPASDRKQVSKPLVQALSQLEIAKRELRNWRQELLECQEARDFAEADSSITRKEELIGQISPINKSLMPVCIEANKEGSSLLVVKFVEEWMRPSQELETPHRSLNAPEQLEKTLAARTDEFRDLRAEMVAIMEDKEKFARETARAVATLEEVRSELEMARQSEGHAVSCVTLLSSELQEAKESLINALHGAISLKTVMGSYQDELQLLRKDITELRDREVFASAAVASLTVELNQTKVELAVSAAAEAKANDTISYLTKDLEQAKSEAEEAKSEADAMRKKVQEARSAAEQAKVAMDTSESKSRACSSEADAEKTYKTVVLDQNKAVFEEAFAVNASADVADVGFVVSQEEYDALKRKLEETEKLASMQVSAALADLAAARASEQEIKQSLRNTNQEVEVMRKAAKQALHKVEMAEAAKSAVEGELGRLREKEQRRRERGVISIIQQPIEQQYIASDTDQSFSFGTTHITPLATVLNMKVPSAREHKKMEKSMTQKRKKNILPSFRGYLVRK